MSRHPPFRLRGSLLGLAGMPAVLALVTACAPLEPVRHDGDAAGTLLRAELAPPAPRKAPLPMAPATTAPASPATAAAPAPAPQPAPPPEPRFDLIVNGAATRDVFLSLVADTPYSMLLHPEVEGQLSLTLRGVTLREVLESLRDVHGFEFRIEGRRITVYPARMQTRIFSVNHLNTRRQGRSEVRVSGGGAPATAPGNNGSNNGGGGGNSPNPAAARPDSSEVTSTSNADYWTEMVEVLKGIVGTGQGRHVIVSAHAGTVAVRAMPEELRQVQAFLKASRVAIERQVMLEAKIIEVELRDGHQSGIDWSYLGRDGGIGQTSGYGGNALLGNANGLPTLPAAVMGLAAETLGVPTGSGGTLGLALASKGFQAVMGFLETHGDVQVLSSPRIATLNNQKAVLKVGVDEYFVTNVSGGSTNSGNTNATGTTSMPSLTLTPFFSGVALDVTPQIDDTGMITLHVRPSVTSVTEKTRQVDLGSIGNYRLPLASSSVNESDTVVRVPDGQIVAIGGLMQSESSRRLSGLPGAQGSAATSTLFSNKATAGRKKELVVLIRPTIIHDSEDWERTTAQALGELDPRQPRRVITVAPAAAAPAQPATAAPPAAATAATAATLATAAAAGPAAAPPSTAAGPAAAALPAGAAAAAAAAAAPAAVTPTVAAPAARAAVRTKAKAKAKRTPTRARAAAVAAPKSTPAPPTVAQATPTPAPAPAPRALLPTMGLMARLWPSRW